MVYSEIHKIRGLCPSDSSQIMKHMGTWTAGCLVACVPEISMHRGVRSLGEASVFAVSTPHFCPSPGMLCSVPAPYLFSETNFE